LNKVEKYLNIFMRISLLIIFIGMIIGNIFSISTEIYKNKFVLSNFNIILIIMYILTILIDIFILKSKISKKKKIILIMLFGTVLRVFWLLNINTPIVSDYLTMYNSAKQLLNGNFYELYGFGYFARFPHLIPSLIYMSFLIKLFPTSHLIVYKFINLIFSIFSMFLIYIISKKILKTEKGQLICLIIASIFPAFIAYISTYCTENLVIWTYLIGILLLFNTIKLDEFKDRKNILKENILLLITGIILGIANLFRAIAIVILIAVCVYIIFFKKNRRIINCLCVVLGYIFITCLVSSILLFTGIIERPLYDAVEPSITSILKGTNIESNGMWNEQDGKYINDNLKNENFENECKEYVVNRIKETPIIKIITLLIKKIGIMWGNGSNGGVYWATLGTNYNLHIIDVFYNIFNIGILTFSIIGLKNNENKLINFMYILIGGYILVFSIIEIQPRYSFIVSYLFIWFSSLGIEKVIEKRRE